MPDTFNLSNPPVLVGVDGSVESLAALGLAATEARLRDTQLLVTHVWAGPHWRPGRFCGERLARTDAERLLASATAWLRVHHPDVTMTGRLVLGDAVQVLAAGSATAQLVVVGHRGHGLHLLGWGSVAAQLSPRSKVPVIVRRFRSEAADPPSSAPVVVAVSLASSGRTLRFAFGAAARYGVPLAPCYVWSPGAETGGLRPTAHDYAAGRTEAARMLAEALAGWSSRYPQVDVRPEVRHGLDVAQTLAVAARQARLLVVGAGPDSSLVEILCGSVSRGLLRTAQCPVAVVPEPVPADPAVPGPMPAVPAAAHPAASEPVGAAGGRSGTG